VLVYFHGGAYPIGTPATRLAAKARAAGVPVSLEVWDEMPHVFHAFAGLLSESDEAIARIGSWLCDRYARTARPV